MDRVAVVILNYNGAAMLRRFLPVVLAHSGGAAIVVADNGSTDESVAVVKEQFPVVRLIELGHNYGFADGYNRALALVEAEFFLLLNSDVEVTTGWLQPLLAFMDANAAAVACQPKVLSFNERECFEYAGAAGGFIDRYGYPFCRGRLFDTVERDCGQYDAPCRLFWATGAALMVRSASFFEAGGFDGSFFAHMEEIDLCWRLQTLGGEVYAVPQSVVYHVGGATLSKDNPRKTYLNFRNNLIMLYKNLPDDELRAVMLVRAVLDYVAALKFLFTGAWGSFRAVLRARCHYRRLRGGYEAARRDNIVSTVGTVWGRLPFSLLWQYYVRGRKTYTRLKM